jgi:hypothetical protein
MMILHDSASRHFGTLGEQVATGFRRIMRLRSDRARCDSSKILGRVALKWYPDTRKRRSAMRQQVHNSHIRFRVSEGLLAAAEAKARREGMSLSELLRHAVRKEVRGAAW